MARKKLNREVIERMITRIQTMPESYDQGTFFSDAQLYADRPAPECGTVACLAGEAVICSADTVGDGVKRLRHANLHGNVIAEARNAMGLEDDLGIFAGDADYWPEPYRTRWNKATTYKAEAKAAVGLLRAVLRTDGKILEQ